jgi:hypothetical protein
MHLTRLIPACWRRDHRRTAFFDLLAQVGESLKVEGGVRMRRLRQLPNIFRALLDGLLQSGLDMGLGDEVAGISGYVLEDADDGLVLCGVVEEELIAEASQRGERLHRLRDARKPRIQRVHGISEAVVDATPKLGHVSPQPLEVAIRLYELALQR